MKPRTALVVGATGFVGRAISETLSGEGWSVVAAARRPAEGPWASFIELDISTPGHSWPTRGMDAVVLAAGLAHDVHGAATSADDHRRVNAEGAANAAAAARRAGSHLVLVSSVKAMADKTIGNPLTETASCHPTTPYGMAKLRGEELAADALQGTDCRLAIIRLTPVYGLGSKGNLARLLQLASKRWLPLLPAEGGDRSMVHVDDVGSLVETVLRKEAVGTFIADDGQRYSPRLIQERVRAQLGFGRTMAFPGAPLRLAAGAASRGKPAAIFHQFAIDLSRFLDDSLFDGSRGRRELRWQTRRTLWSELGELLRKYQEK